jgi:methylated-DNA-protein-cysteine methyltransferase related protein
MSRADSKASAKPVSSTYSRIYRTVKKIPRGRVATYGQIARLAGFPRHARLVGYALHALRSDVDPSVPWHRVINAKGEISLDEFSGADLQRKLLQAEGVIFDRRHRVDLERFGWKK